MFLVRFFSKPTTVGRTLAGAGTLAGAVGVSIYMVRNKVTRAQRKEANEKAIADQAATKEAKALATKNSLDFDKKMEEIRRVEREADKQRAAKEKKAKADAKKKMAEEYAAKMEKKREEKRQKEQERREKEAAEEKERIRKEQEEKERIRKEQEEKERIRKEQAEEEAPGETAVIPAAVTDTP